MNTHSNFERVTYNDDGSTTVESSYTEFPPTKKQQAATWLALVGVMGVAFSPIIFESAVDWRDRRKAKRELKKTEKTES